MCLGVYKHDPKPQTYIDICSIPELIIWNFENNTLVLGGNISLNRTLEIFREESIKNTNFLYLDKMADHIELMANVPVRNVRINIKLITQSFYFTIDRNSCWKLDDKTYPS